jgi:hypothetical protein
MLEIQEIAVEHVFVGVPPRSIAFNGDDINHFPTVMRQPLGLPFDKVTHVNVETFHLKLALGPVVMGDFTRDNGAPVWRFDFHQFVMFRDSIGRDAQPIESPRLGTVDIDVSNQTQFVDAFSHDARKDISDMIFIFLTVTRCHTAFERAFDGLTNRGLAWTSGKRCVWRDTEGRRPDRGGHQCFPDGEPFVAQLRILRHRHEAANVGMHVKNK